MDKIVRDTSKYGLLVSQGVPYLEVSLFIVTTMVSVPLVTQVMTKNKYNYTNYELLLVRLLRVSSGHLSHLSYRTTILPVLQDEPLSPEDDVDRQLKAGKSKSVEDDSAEIEAASFKKFPLEPNALTRVC